MQTAVKNMISCRKQNKWMGLLTVIWLASLPSAQAQLAPWPSITKIIVPVPAGGSVDIVARKFAEIVGPKLGTTMMVENRVGASGLIAAKAAAAGLPDGSSIFYLHPGLLTTQVITGRLDILAEFKAVTKLSSWPLLLVVSGNSPYRTQAELISAMQANAGQLNYSSGGNGSPSHLAFEWMDTRVSGGVKATHIPFKGNIDAVVALLGGQVDFTFSLLSNVNEHIKTGKLRALSITCATRSSLYPQVPTVSEAGIAGYSFDTWGALMVPAKTSETVVASIFEAVKASASSPDFMALIARGGGVAELSSSPAAFSAQLRTALIEEKSVVERLRLKSP